MKSKRAAKTQAVAIGIFLLAACCVIAGINYLYGPKPAPPDDTVQNADSGTEGDAEGPPDEAPPASLDQLNQSIEAVAASEDADYTRALQLWRQLKNDAPDEVAFHLNEAVTVLKWIDENRALVTSGNVKDPVQLEQLQAELENAYQEADAVIQGLADLPDSGSRGVLLQASLMEANAVRLSYPESDALRLQASELLVQALANMPSDPLLAAFLDELVQRVGQDSESLSAAAADALYTAWKSDPRNLHLLARGISNLLTNQDPRLAELLLESIETTRPLWPIVQRDVDRLDPETFIPAAIESIESGDWTNRALRVNTLRWRNVIVGMKPAYSSDLRLVKPDIMALLDTSFLNRLDKPDPVATDDPTSPEFTAVTPAGIGQQVLWLDWDIDLDFDLVVINGSELRLHPTDGGQILAMAEQTVDVGFPIVGAAIGEFFGVDDPDRPRVSRTVAEMMESDGQSPASDSAQGPSNADLPLTQFGQANRHDTLQEILVWGESGVAFVVVSVEDDKSSLKLLEDSTGLEEIAGVLAAAVFDLESDGDLDIMLTTPAGVHVMQNNGNRTFVDIAEHSRFEDLPSQIRHLRACDFDSDLDQDLLAIADGQDVVWLIENIQHGQFSARPLSSDAWPHWPDMAALEVTDLDGNASWDLIVAGSTQSGAATTRTPRNGEIVPLNTLPIPAGGTHLAVEDFNNDTTRDVLLAGEQGLSLHLGNREGWSAATLPSDAPTNIQSLATCDFNVDGFVDVAMVDSRGQVLVWQTQPTQAGFVEARVTGINDENGGGRNNHYGIGTTLELWTDGRLLRESVDSPVTHFGVGAGTVQNVRVVFPNGLTQNVEQPDSNVVIEERQELKGSCPFVYGWDGKKFALITDLLWNAPLGLQVAPGIVVPDRRWEYLFVPGELMQPRDGHIELRVTEELWEVAYLDHLRLTAVDHPADSRLFTNEKVGPPDQATPQNFVVNDPILPVSASSGRQSDILNRIARKDGAYVQPFHELMCQGLATPHYLELDFGDAFLAGLKEGQQARLYLTGWLYPTDTSLNIGISQNVQRSGPEPPSLWIPNAEGDWELVMPSIGFPGGKPKSIVIELPQSVTDRMRSHGSSKMRIAGSQQIYWDEAFVAFDNEAIPHAELDCPLVAADLHYRGFSQLLPRPADQPHWYDYQRTSQLAKWPPLEGPFTRFGDVLELLTDDDDLMVVMGSGDEISLRFHPPARPLRSGWKRDYVLHCTGWDKDADLNTLAGQGSMPLPFKNQTSYPASVDQTEQVEAVMRKNRPFLNRRGPQNRPQTLVH